MKILIERTRVSALTADGQLSIDGDYVCDTAEATPTLLRKGTYRIALFKCPKFKRKIPVVMVDSPSRSEGLPKPPMCRTCAMTEGLKTTCCPKLACGNGAYNRTDGDIIVGTNFMPGIVFETREIFSRIYGRIRKTISRGHDVQLVIQSVAVIAIAFAMTGCRTTRSIVAHEAAHDTLYVNNVRYDSIYIDRLSYIDRTADTVVIRDKSVEYRYRLLHDTTRIVRIDTIPVVHEVEVTRTVRQVPAIYKWSLAILILMVIFIIIRIIVRIIGGRI